MKQRAYYSTRTGKNLSALKFDIQALRRLFNNLYQRYSEGGYFQEAFGYFCVDQGKVSGTLGADIEAHLLLALRKCERAYRNRNTKIQALPFINGRET